MLTNVLIGGKAGQGPNVLANIISEILVKTGYYVFLSREYESVIRGGHNYNILTFSDTKVYSNENKIDILICLDDNTELVHKSKIRKETLVLRNKDNKENIYFAGKLLKILGFDFKFLEIEIKKLRNFDANLKNAKEGYESENSKFNLKTSKNKTNYFMNGAQGVKEGALKGGMDVYFAYPMTPATSLLSELAEKQVENNILTLELENEIAVFNAAIGSAITGAKSMVGTSGGGFDLMTEALSLAGIGEIPVVAYLAQRPGPATGVATKTAQGDLNIALYSGHGEFSRVVVAPGDPIESAELTSALFYLSQKFKIPCLILSDKQLAESFYTLNGKANIVKSEKLTSLKRYNSYEHLDSGEATEDTAIVEKNVERRLMKANEIKREVEKLETCKVYGKGKTLIVGWGSTKGAIFDAIQGLDARFLQVLYLEPFSDKIVAELKKADNIIVVENNATAQLANLITAKTGIFIKNKILKYNGLPFYSDELKEEIKKRMK
ncbi:2-oxoacid:acceptor oxidoreductase family protein [Candidatus Woesearchaeota archaeon]|nr:2-oxoacid:acceptor oxidoreductase family protein [Candidatus Woesearchaeota archaeon]